MIGRLFAHRPLCSSLSVFRDPAKNCFTRLPRKENKIPSATGTPTKVHGSSPKSPMRRSLTRLIVNRTIASQYPQRAPRHKPIAAAAQATQTALISPTPHPPRLLNSTCARGFKRQISSHELPGQSSRTVALELAMAPRKKRRLSMTIPVGRWFAAKLCIGQTPAQWLIGICPLFLRS